MNNEQCAIPSKPTLRDKFRSIKYNILYWILLNIWYGRLYIFTMKIMHKYDLHHMPASQPSKLENGEKIFHRCSWCGLYGYKFNYNKTQISKINYNKIQLPKRQEF